MRKVEGGQGDSCLVYCQTGCMRNFSYMIYYGNNS